MESTPPDPDEGVRPGEVPSGSLVERQLEEMIAAWESGGRPRAEEFLARHPGLRDEDAVRLVYEEACLRLEGGETSLTAEYFRRFPRWRSQIGLLLECKGLLGATPGADFPQVGDDLGDFRLLAEIGRGALGRTFVASQRSLADRSLVLKITPLGQEEHLSLARLQHMHIVPLYFEQIDPVRNVRILGMPYLGGASLAHLLAALDEVPVAGRTGRHLLDMLDRCAPALPAEYPASGQFRKYLGQESYVRAICWIVAWLADALQYAHERGLVHFDVKPSNVLIAGDGQPMLLDFHLAQGPLVPGRPAPEHLGGTPGYLSPEQRAAMRAIGREGVVTVPVDGRSDIYSLGLLLHEALGGDAGADDAPRRPLERCNPRVSPCLRAIVRSYYTFSVSNGVGSTTAVVAIQVFANLPNVTYTPGGAAVATQPFGARFSQVSDPDNTAPLTYSLVTAPAGMTIDPATGLLAWTPAVSDIGNAYATVRATNYAGSRDTALTIPVAFAGPVQDVAATDITTDSADLAWSPPAVSSEPIQGYHVTVTYTLGSGRSVTFHTLKFTTTGDATNLTMTGLPVYKTQYVSVAAYDANGRDGLAGSASFTTAYATPTVAVGGGPFTYDGSTHAATPNAYGVDGVTPVSGTFTSTYDGSATPPTAPGTYAVVSAFTSGDPYYTDAVGSGLLTINPAIPAVTIGGGPFPYDGGPHAATLAAVGIDGVTPVNGTFTITYNGSPTPPTNPGIYALAATFTSGDPNYYDGYATGTLTISKATPVFSNLGSPTITAGTASTTLTGRIAAGPVSPTGDPISITVNGVTRTANVTAGGTFSVSFPTGTLPAGSYTITYAFAGDATRFNAAASGGGTLTVNPALVAPGVTTNPQSRSTRAGNSVTFTAAANGNPTPTVQWQVSTNGGTTYTNIAGATGTTLTFTTTSGQNGYRYRAVFTNSVGTATTSAATLTV